jgi:glycosyltransferase involved in cell wall biosynthesis
MNPSKDRVVDLGIVIAARNAEATITRALRSVAEAVSECRANADISLGTVDIVLIDGASTDATVDLAAAAADVRIISQSGIGLAHARNQGVAEVRGEIIAFLDADDRWSGDAISRRLVALTQHPATGGVVGQMVLEALPGQPVDVRHRDRLGVPTAGFTPGALLIRRDSFESIGPFDESLTIAADSEWFVRSRTGEPPLVIDAIVLIKGARHDSLSADVRTYRRELHDVSRRFLASREDS